MRKDVNDICNIITQKVKQDIIENDLIKNDDKIVVAVSGGPDSMCLLDILCNLKDEFKEKYNISYSLVVAHVNHSIRQESEYEKIYVEECCRKYNVPFYYLKSDVPTLAKELKISLETCGRKVRYDFFDKIKEKTNSTKIAVAHNLDDNVETILLNIIRGCALNGLIGINFTFNDIIRPLLSIEKKEILEYNIKKDLNPCFDITNEQAMCLRNKVRLELLPILKNEYNSNIVKNIIRMKDVLSNDENFLNEYTDNIVDRSIIDKSNSTIKFNLSNIINQHIAIRQRCIRNIIKLKQDSLEGIENIHVADIDKLLCNNIKGKKYIIGNKFSIEITSKNIAVIY